MPSEIPRTTLIFAMKSARQILLDAGSLAGAFSHSEISAGAPETRVTTPGGHAGIDEGAKELGRRRRRRCRRLNDNRAAGGERRGELAHCLIDGKFQGVNAATGPTGSFERHLHGSSRARRNHLAASAARLLSEPIDDVGAAINSPLASAKGLPCSRVRSQAMRSPRSRSKPAALHISLDRSNAEVELQSLKPRSAAASAASRSGARYVQPSRSSPRSPDQ